MNQLLQPGEHSGFIEVAPTLTDWKAGGETGIIEANNLPSSDWRPFLSAGEWQRFFWTATNGMAASFETDACVSFSGSEAVETFMNMMVAGAKYSPDDIAWLKSNGYFDTTGKIKLAPRFTAKMSGTTIDGNSLPAVAASLRTDGCVPLAMWDAPLAAIEALDVSQENWATTAWNLYYAAVPATVIALGSAFAARFDVQYEWISFPTAPLIPAQYLQKLTTAPLQIATAVCPPWNTAAPIAACGAGSAHATLMDFYTNNVCFNIRDHYDPFDKELAPDYNITYSMRIVVVSKAVAPTTFPAPTGFTHDFTVQMDFGTTSIEVTALQNALKLDGEFPVTVQSTGYFGSVTQLAVEAFQAKHGIVASGTPTTTGYGRVGNKTMAVLNSLFNK